jgi:hypothetical protein
MSSENDRSKRVETSVAVYRLRLAALPGGVVVFGWDYPGSTLLRVRILRAPAERDGPVEADADPGLSGNSGDITSGPEPTPEPDPESSWRVAYDGDTGSFRDRGLPAGSAWRYAVFARDGDGPWTLWRDEVVIPP